MSPGNDRAPGGGTEGATNSQVMTECATRLPEGRDNTAQTRRVKVGRFTPNPPNTRRVTRPSRWGNPHKVGPCQQCGTVHTAEQAVAEYASALYAGRLAITVADVRRELAGFDLACACDLDAPCHGNVLLRVAGGAS